MRLPPVPDDAEYRDRLRWSLARVEGWVNNADGKATIVLGLDGVLAAALFGLRHSLPLNCVGIAVAVVSSVALLWSAACAALAIFPDIAIRRREERKVTSIYHFATVANTSADEFRTQYRSMSSSQDCRELEHQIYVNSRIATRKFARLRLSIIGVLVLLLIVVGLGACGLLATHHASVVATYE